LREDLPRSLADLDRDIADLVDGYLTARAVAYRRSDEAGRVVFDVASGTVLPVEVGNGRRFATGDARSLTDAEALNLVHPLVRAAIARARTWSDGNTIKLKLSPGSSPELTALAGKVGLLSVVLVEYVGFEPVQRLVGSRRDADRSIACREAHALAGDRQSGIQGSHGGAMAR